MGLLSSGSDTEQAWSGEKTWDDDGDGDDDGVDWVFIHQMLWYVFYTDGYIWFSQQPQGNRFPVL